MDPFIYLPPEVCDSILKYLAGNDLLKAAKVSKTWNSTIGASSTAMDKIRLNIPPLNIENCGKGDIEKILKTSERKYKHVIVSLESSYISSLTNILQSHNNGHWKSLTIERFVFGTMNDCVKLLTTCCETIEELTINNIYIRTVDGLAPVHLPKLKVLKINEIDVRDESITSLFADCRKLRDLNLRTTICSPQAIESIKGILMNNHDLKKLKIMSNIFAAITAEKLPFQFKLETFSLNDFCATEPQVSYLNFLQNQRNFLLHISLDAINCPETLKFIFQIPNLKTVELGKIDTKTTNFNIPYFKINKSIEKLSYVDHDNTFSLMKRIVDAIPNVKDMNLHSLTQGMMEYLSLTAKHLEVLKLRTIQAENVSMKYLFPNLKKVSIDIIPPVLDDKIEWARTHKANPFITLLKKCHYIVLD